MYRGLYTEGPSYTELSLSSSEGRGFDRGPNKLKPKRGSAFEKLQSEREAKDVKEDLERDEEERQQIRQEEREERKREREREKARGQEESS